MNAKYRILIPVGLAVVATAANFVLLQQATATTGVLVLARDVPAGQKIHRDDLTVAKVRAEPAVFAAAFPAADATELIGLQFCRDMPAGGLVLKTDVDVSGFDVKPAAGEFDCSLLVQSNYASELNRNESVMFTLPDAESGKLKQFGPFRVIGVRQVNGRTKAEHFSRITFAGPDVLPVVNLKIVSGDEFKLGDKTYVSRVGKGVTAGQKVDTQGQANGQ